MENIITQFSSVTRFVCDLDNTNPLYLNFVLGGVPENNVAFNSNQNFNGCMVNVEINNKILQLSDDAVDPNVTFPKCR